MTCLSRNMPPATNSGIYGIYRNTSTGTTVSFAPPVVLSPFEYTGAAVGDLDGDGKLDGRDEQQYGEIFRSTSSPGTISFAASIPLTAGNAVKGIYITDIDADGKADIAVNHYPDAVVSLYRNISGTGNPAFAARFNMPVPGGDNIVVTDLDGDFKPDIVVPSAVSNYSSLLKNNSTKGTIWNSHSTVRLCPFLCEFG